MLIFSCIYLIIYEIFQIYFAFRSICTTFAPGKHCHGLSLVSSWHERKVRAAQGAPLLKVEAIGDSRLGQKRMTAELLLSLPLRRE